MAAIPRRITRTEDAVIKRRLLMCLPASRFEMETLTRLAGIHVTRALPTAAVECKRRPRLLINPDFVEEHCQRDEHLFLLVMHELWHVLLAHTRMYPRMTRAQNVAFDAIINAGLMREFSGPEYRGFFESINAAEDFPGCLLRPPVGWPDHPVYPEAGPPGTRDLLMRLYPPHMLTNVYTPPMYEEVLNLLLRSGIDWFKDTSFLLGNHNPDDENDPLMKDLMRQVSGQWPSMAGFGRGVGGNLGRTQYAVDAASENMRRRFSQVLRLCIAPRPGRTRRKARTPIASSGGTGVLPNARDRLAMARRQLGAPETLWTQPATTRARLPEKPSKAYIYLDVSGSMYSYLPHLLGLITPYVAHQDADVYQFSTAVRHLPLIDLRAGDMTTTGGTDINCVFEHLMEADPRPSRVLILTDGEVGGPTLDLERQMRDSDVKLYVVMPEDCTLHPEVAALAASVVLLPSIG